MAKAESLVKSSANENEAKAELLAAAKDLISDWLDKSKGSGVTQNEIFSDLSRYWEQKFHEDPEYENVKFLLEDPVQDAQFIMAERFPMPRFFITKPNDTQERKIKARVNPSSLSTANTTVNDGNYFTEDVSLSVFMQHLIKMAVQS